MSKIEEDMIALFGYICMFLMIVGAVTATTFFHLYRTLIGFMFSLILVYISRRIVFVEKVRKQAEDYNG